MKESSLYGLSQYSSTVSARVCIPDICCMCEWIEWDSNACCRDCIFYQRRLAMLIDVKLHELWSLLVREMLNLFHFMYYLELLLMCRSHGSLKDISQIFIHLHMLVFQLWVMRNGDVGRTVILYWWVWSLAILCYRRQNSKHGTLTQLPRLLHQFLLLLWILNHCPQNQLAILHHLLAVIIYRNRERWLWRR